MLTRRAKQYSQKYTVVVKFSRSRKRYERQGLLVNASALQQAENEFNGLQAKQASEQMTNPTEKIHEPEQA